MADTTKRAEIILAMKDELTAASSEAVDQLKQINEGIRDLSKSTEDNKSTMSGWQMTMIAVNQGLEIGQKAVEAFKKVWEFSKEGAAIQRIGAQFKATAEEAGMDADRLLASMDKAAHGTVDDEELMQAATRSLTQGVIKNADDMTKFMEIARASSVRFGGDTAQAFQQIMYATEVGAQRTLKATIGVVDFQKAYDDLANKLGKRKQDLTDEEQLQARVNAVLEKGADLVKKVGDAGEDAATRMQRFETRVANIGDELKTGATDAILPFLDGLDLLEKSLHENMRSVPMLQAEYQYLSDVFGANSQQAQFVKQELDKATEAEAQLAQTTEEKAVRAGMAQVRVLEAQTRAIGDLGVGMRNQQDVYNTLDAVMSNTQARQQLIASQINMTIPPLDLALQYTDIETKRADIVAKLDELDEKIAANGPRRTAVVSNQKMTEEQRQVTLLKLAAAQEDLSTIQRKSGESDAEYALRLETTKQKVDDLSTSLGTHTAVLGGATKAQLEQRDALQGQLDEFDKAAEKQKAVDVFNAISESVKSGALSAQEGSARLGELNKVAHLYSETALSAAQNQLALIAAMTNPKSEDWLGLLIKSSDALDGMTAKESAATTSVSKPIAESSRLLDIHNRKLEEMESKQDESIMKSKEGWGAIPGMLDAAQKRYDSLRRDSIEPTTKATQAAVKEVDNLSRSWGMVPRDVTTNYKINITGEVPTKPPMPNERARGGPVEPLQAYTVGENGPETLLMGSAGGYVVPHARGGGRQSGGEISVMVKVEAGAFQFMGVTAADAELITARVSQQLAAKMRSVISNPVGVT